MIDQQCFFLPFFIHIYRLIQKHIDYAPLYIYYKPIPHTVDYALLGSPKHAKISPSKVQFKRHIDVSKMNNFGAHPMLQVKLTPISTQQNSENLDKWASL